MTVDGTWNVSVLSPMGRQEGTLVLRTVNGELTGTTTNFGSIIPISSARLDGSALSWVVRAQQPFPMLLEFAVMLHDDTMSGTVKAGPLGESPLTGTRST